MRSARLGLAVLGFCLAGLASEAVAQNGGMCHAPDPVLLILVESAPKVGPAAAGLSRTPVLVEASDTVIYADGRAVTSDLAAISQHLNALGWAQRKIEIVGAGTSTRLPPASRTKRRG